MDDSSMFSQSLFSLTPIGFVILYLGLGLAGVALIFFRNIPSINSENPKLVDEKQQFEITIKVDEWKISEPIVIKDKKGASATIKIVVLSQDFTWKLGSDNVIERFGQIAEIGPHLQSRGISKAIKEFIGIISIGAASG